MSASNNGGLSEQEAIDLLGDLADRYSTAAVQTIIRGNDPEMSVTDQDRQQIRRATDILGEDAAIDAAEGQTGLGSFTSERMDRRTGRVVGTGPVGNSELEVQTGMDVEIPQEVQRKVIETTERALGKTRWYVPRDTTAATFVWDDTGVTDLTVGWDPATDPPRKIGPFQYMGRTVPDYSEKYLDRYTYEGPRRADIDTIFIDREQAKERHERLVRQLGGEDEYQQALREKGWFEGPITGTFRPTRTSPVVFSEARWTEEGAPRAGLLPSAGGDDMMLYVDIVRKANDPDTWLVELSLRGTRTATGELANKSIVTVPVEGTRSTKTGAFGGAFQVMTSRSPNILSSNIVESIENDPDLVEAGLAEQIREPPQPAPGDPPEIPERRSREEDQTESRGSLKTQGRLDAPEPTKQQKASKKARQSRTSTKEAERKRKRMKDEDTGTKQAGLGESMTPGLDDFGQESTDDAVTEVREIENQAPYQAMKQIGIKLHAIGEITAQQAGGGNYNEELREALQSALETLLDNATRLKGNAADPHGRISSALGEIIKRRDDTQDRLKEAEDQFHTFVEDITGVTYTPGAVRSRSSSSSRGSSDTIRMERDSDRSEPSERTGRSGGGRTGLDRWVNIEEGREREVEDMGLGDGALPDREDDDEDDDGTPSLSDFGA